MRLILKKIINKLEDFKLIGEAENGEEAIKYVEDFNPDVVFLDIEMPHINGIECAKKIIDINPKASIIFATAHEQFMPDAFELYAFDYLTKPFRIDRIYKTLRKIKKIHNDSDNIVLDNIANDKKVVDKLIIRNKEGISFVDKEDIILIERENRNTLVHTSKSKYTTSEGLGQLEDKLEKDIFFRSHRSYIINISKITRIEPYSRWTYVVKFKDFEKDALITHEKYGELEEILTGKS